jgi:Entner-Doudoroff aldolase
VAAAHGLGAIEVPFTVPRAAHAIAALRERLEPDVVIGAGTVRTKGDLHDALGAGAEFLVAPGLNPELVKAAQSAGVLMVPGVYTASEVELALGLGLRLLKLFPAVPAGPEYLAALLQPFPEARFMPTGGVGPDTAAAFLKAGAAVLGMGSSIFPQRRIEMEGPQVVAGLTEAALRAAL